MRVTVAGLWHLGCVTAACCAKRFSVTGFDDDVSGLQAGRAPLFEPGLDELLAANPILFTNNPAEACRGADVLWVTYDTPVDDDDQADIEFVLERVRKCVPFLQKSAVVLISSQVPVGTCRKLEGEFPGVAFAYSPENLQLGKAIAAFENAERAVVGLRDDSKKPVLEELLSPFCKRIIWMRTESAEMVKHGLNAFLALSITFINELAGICEKMGADAKELTEGLKSDIRIGPKAYLGAGGAFAGGTLARDVVSLTRIAQEMDQRLDVIPAIKRSNDWHRSWAFRRLGGKLGDLSGRRIALMGLTYKPGTDTLRRSLAMELANALQTAGASVVAFDPVVKEAPIRIAANPTEAATGCDAMVVCTEWPEFRDVPWQDVIGSMKRALVLDANRFLEKGMPGSVEYISVGRA